MPSHVIDQTIFNLLPPFLLLNWAAAYTQSHYQPVDFAALTIAVVESLLTDLSQRYGVAWCGHLICRRCLQLFKRAHHQGTDAVLLKYITFVLHKCPNEGDSDTCHRRVPNFTIAR